MTEVLHILWHSIVESAMLIPFLFITYLLMEYLEHHSSDLSERVLKRSGQLGSLIGAALGLIPQCGFSSAAAGLYSARVISLGTMVAVFLSTSDEMLPIFLTNNLSVGLIAKILIVKFLIALAVGVLTDLMLKIIYKKLSLKQESKIEEFCEREDCHCHTSILKPALIHTLKVGGFILLITTSLNLIIHLVGEDALASFIKSSPILANILSALVGVIPNCASSVVISELFAGGYLSAGAMMSGLLINSGIALAVLFRTNRPIKHNVYIVLVLFAVAVSMGILIDITPLAQWLSI